MSDDKTIDLGALDDGCYYLEDKGSFSEAVRFASAAWDRLHMLRVRLPDGKGNIIYLMTDTFENSFKLLESKYFMIPPATYRKFYYPTIALGNFFKRRYRMNLTPKRSERVGLIKSKKFIPYPTRKIATGDKTGIFFAVADLYQLVKPIIQKYPIIRITRDFYKEFHKLILDYTPEYDGPVDPNSGNRIMLFDVEAFKFKPGASLNENKTNPLFILYLAYFRMRNPGIWNVDLDILLTAKNSFIKFNPSRLTPDKFNKFRTAFFRIMGMNLDQYCANLSEEDKKELDITSEDLQLQDTVDKVLDPYTKMSSPETKDIVSTAVADSVKKNINAAKATAAVMRVRGDKPKPPSSKHLQLFNKVVGIDMKTPLIAKTGMDVPQDEELPSVALKTVSVRQSSSPITFDAKKRQLFNKVTGVQYQALSTDTGEEIDDEDIAPEDMDAEIAGTLINDKDVAEEILDGTQENIVPISDVKTSPVNSARDLKLREAQKKIVVQNSTVEEILERESTNVPLQGDDKSSHLTTTNESMKTIKFSNFDKTYIDTLMMKDLVACFDCLKDRSVPMYIKSIDIEDTSTTSDLKDTWTVKLVDAYKQNHTIKVDVPRFYENRFMHLGGVKKIIQKQNFYNPVVKDTPDTVMITTNQKMQVKRIATRSFAQVERIFSLVRKIGDSDTFITGNSSKINQEYISSLEFDELSSKLFQFKTKNCEIVFNRHHLEENVVPNFSVPDMKKEEFIIGSEGKQPIIINYDTGYDRRGRTIVDIIADNLSDEHRKIFNSIKSSKRSMFVEAKLAGLALPVIVILGSWVGISRVLDLMEIEWEFQPGVKRVKDDSDYCYLKFADGVLRYKSVLYAQLIMNGLNKLKINEINFDDLNSEKGYIPYLHFRSGTYTFYNQLENFHEFMMDPITIDVCKHLMLPTKAEELIIYAVKLLCDNTHVSKASDKSYRVRSVEIIPAILYTEIRKAYGKYRSQGGKKPMSLKREIIIDVLNQQPTVESYSTLNPAIEVGQVYRISAKGYSGTNLDESYDEEKRSYDETSLGKLAMSSNPDLNIGISRELVVEPMIVSARGYRVYMDPKDVDSLDDATLLSPVEMLTPGTARMDDSIRVAMAGKQSRHLVPVEDASPSLVSNGYDEAIQFHLSSDFVINAEENGEVVEVDDKTGMIVVRYASGKHRAFSVSPEVVYNSGDGFYVSNQLKSTVKMGDKFKKNDVLAYHPKFFRYSKLNGLRYAIGPLAKIAFMSTYNTYEDAGICTQKLAEQLRTAIVYPVDATLTKNVNVHHMAKIGDNVNIGDSLLRYEVGFDDTEINRYLTQLSNEENREMVMEESKSDITAKYAGKIVDIQVTSLPDPSNLSPSLAKIVTQYWNRGNDKKKLLNKYDRENKILKAGYMLTDSTEPHVNKYNRIGHYQGIDVLIRFFIEHEDIAAVGDKIALYSANKQIISEVIPKGYEPYSEQRPEEEISALFSPGTLARRFTSSALPVAMSMKLMIELKRKIKEEIKYG